MVIIFIVDQPSLRLAVMDNGFQDNKELICQKLDLCFSTDSVFFNSSDKRDSSEFLLFSFGEQANVFIDTCFWISFVDF